MSISLYYSATRAGSLTEAERALINRLIADYSVRDAVEQYIEHRTGHNGMDFCVYLPSERTAPDVIFEGATKLPDNSDAFLWELVQHWCALLTKLRLVLPTASWRVHVDDHDIKWDEVHQAYDPSK
jgi:hypothetical protein